MGSIFSLDSPLMRGMSKVADLLILNLLVIVTSIPIFTIGASLSAMHYVLIKMSRNEGTYVTEMFFKSFKENFKQGTALWGINLLVIALCALDIYLFFTAGNSMPSIVLLAVVIVGAILLMTCMYFYPLQARFINPVGKTVKNAFFIMILNFPKSIVMAILYLIPVGLLFVAFFMIPMVFLFGISAPGYGAALLYKSVFLKLEPKQEEVASDMDFHIALDDENEESTGEVEEITGEGAEITGNVEKTTGENAGATGEVEKNADEVAENMN